MRRSVLLRILIAGVLMGNIALVYVAVTNRMPEDDDLKENTRSMKQKIKETEIFGKEATFKVIEGSKNVKNTSDKHIKSVNRSNYFISGSYRVWGFSYDIFLLSVVTVNSSTTSVWDHVAIQGWEHQKYQNTSFTCCMLYKSEIIQQVHTTKKIHWKPKTNTKMVAKQYICPNPRAELKDFPTAVTLSGGIHQACHRNYGWYLPLHLAHAHKKEIAVCTKIISASVSADDILAWFAVHRRLGMNKVLVYTHDLDPAAGKVLQHYKTLGVAELVPFSLPKMYQEKQLVEMGPKEIQSWNIEQTLVNDCYQKLKGYKYMVVLDVDEYLIPNKAKTWKELFEKLWKTTPTAAGFMFKVNLHITSWDVTNNSSKFTAGKYTDRMSPQADRMKHVTNPDRVTLGGFSSHSFTPEKGFKAFRAPNATIHHFRSCRKSNDWEEEVDKTCQNLGKFRDTSVANILAPLENDIMKLKYSIFNRGRSAEGVPRILKPKLKT